MLSESLRNLANHLERRLRDPSPVVPIERVLLLDLLEDFAERAQQLEENGMPVTRPRPRTGTAGNVITADFGGRAR